jgi:D-aminoacyl-tRNA deacylase
MRLCIQRVKNASVTIDGEVCGAITEPGLVVLIGIGDGDAETEEGSTAVADGLVEWACKHMLETKFWADEAGRPWKVSAEMKGCPLLLVSQFTLYAKLYKKGKLDFHHAMPPAPAEQMYLRIVEEMQKRIGAERVQTGRFGANMDVALVNDGPLTVNLDSVDPIKRN